MKIYERNSRWRCKVSSCEETCGLRVGNWFEGSRISFICALRFIYLWSKKLTSITFCAVELYMAPNTVVDWNNYLHEVCVRIHNTHIKTVDCGDEAAEFFQDFLGRKDIRLVRYSSEFPTRQYLGSDPIFHKLLKGSPSTLQDLSSLHLASQSSIVDLNTRLEKDVSELNFRPNVLVDGAPAFDEDNWEHVKFSSGAILDVRFPCGRCILTTNDPETGIKTDKDPLKTLRKFRIAKDKKLSKSMGHAPLFGINCWLQKGGKISVGDDLYVVIKKGHFACEG